MELVKVKIQQDENTTRYISIIRKADKKTSIGDIKKAIMTGSFALIHDLESFDMVEELLAGKTQYKRNMNFYKLLQELQKAGAKLEIYIGDRKEDMTQLKNWIKTIHQIGIDVDSMPD